MNMSIEKVIEILDSGKAPETEQDFDDFNTAMETAINLLRTHHDNQLNDPLTLEELRELDGEPVYLDLGDGGEWALVRLREDGIYFSHKNSICAPATIAFSCGGRVYRRKPKEGK